MQLPAHIISVLDDIKQYTNNISICFHLSTMEYVTRIDDEDKRFNTDEKFYYYLEEKLKTLKDQAAIKELEKKMNTFQNYKRTNIAQMRKVTDQEIINGCDPLIAKGISISKADINNGSPNPGDMIARNPDNHNDQWLVAAQYFKDNFELE